MIIILIILGLCFWFGYKLGYYILELYEKNTISLNEVLGLIFFTLLFPLSIIIAIANFFEENGNKTIITRRRKGGYNPPPKNPLPRQKPTPMPPSKQ